MNKLFYVVVIEMDLTSIFWVVLVRMAGPRGLRRKAGAFICRERVVRRCKSGARSCGVEAKKESASGDSVAVMRVGRTVCYARQGTAAWRCSAEPTLRPPSLGGIWNTGEVASRYMSCDQKPTTSVSNLVASSSGTKLLRSTWLTGSTDVHGEKVIDCLRI